MESIPDQASADKLRIRFCMGSSCFSKGNNHVADLARRLVEGAAPGSPLAEAELSGSLCEGRCRCGPIIVIDGEVHQHMTPGIFEDVLRRGEA